MEMMFTLHLEQMKYLRRVTLRITKMSNDVISTAAEWINDCRRSGHVQRIVIDTACSSDDQQSNHLLASLMDKIEFKKRIRLDCTSLQPFPASVVQYMPTTLTYLDLAEETSKGCRGEVNKLVFGTDPDSVFVHLRTLYIQVCCSSSGLYDFQSFVPERFPVLSCLAMCVPEQSCRVINAKR
ncbi:hypothetical protein GQ42DRAFT_171701 [Ramicandelaber brevisporus]|nr:hypothetical protein GQ42DRAFT_171701 [Ramicandelaber brevisporus]